MKKADKFLFLRRLLLVTAGYLSIGLLLHIVNYCSIYPDRVLFDLIFWPVMVFFIGLDRIGIFKIPQW